MRKSAVGLLVLFLAGCGGSPSPSNTTASSQRSDMTVTPSSLSFGNAYSGTTIAFPEALTNSRNFNIVIEGVSISGTAFDVDKTIV